jgi:hypothetical protein
MQRDIDKQHQVKIISYQKVLAVSGAEDMPKLGRGHTRMLLTRQGVIDMVDLLLGKEQQGPRVRSSCWTGCSQRKPCPVIYGIIINGI